MEEPGVQAAETPSDHHDFSARDVGGMIAPHALFGGKGQRAPGVHAGLDIVLLAVHSDHFVYQNGGFVVEEGVEEVLHLARLIGSRDRSSHLGWVLIHLASSSSPFRRGLMAFRKKEA
ncbi:MAG: hypothetical protein HRU37_14580 [Roseibacillus sp.]|nr:hypothetical protein [Roseibacillus sp.]